MEYIKVSRVIVRVRNSSVARCPQRAERILGSITKRSMSTEDSPGRKQHGQVEDLNFIP